MARYVAMAEDSAGAAPDVLEYRIDRKGRVIGSVLMVSAAAFFVIFVVGLLVEPQVSPLARAIMVPTYSIVGALYVTWGVRRLLGARVTADRSGLYIYNGLRTHVVGWRDVDGFTEAFQPFLMAVKRHHGRKITLTAVTGGTWTDRTLQQERMRQLEAFWRRMVATD
jgi:hypothetical protein